MMKRNLEVLGTVQDNKPKPNILSSNWNAPKTSKMFESGAKGEKGFGKFQQKLRFD